MSSMTRDGAVAVEMGTVRVSSGGAAPVGGGGFR